MRAILVALIVLSSAMQAAADENCRTVSDVIRYVESKDAAATYLFLEQLPYSVVFASPDRQKFMVVGFNKQPPLCVNYHRVLTRDQFQDWLNGEQQ